MRQFHGTRRCLATLLAACISKCQQRSARGERACRKFMQSACKANSACPMLRSTARKYTHAACRGGIASGAGPSRRRSCAEFAASSSRCGTRKISGSNVDPAARTQIGRGTFMVTLGHRLRGARRMCADGPRSTRRPSTALRSYPRTAGSSNRNHGGLQARAKKSPALERGAENSASSEERGGRGAETTKSSKPRHLRRCGRKQPALNEGNRLLQLLAHLR